MHSVLIIGQSNMGGRGFQNEVDPLPNDRIFVLRNGRWRPMYVPVNPDRVTSGINLAESFCLRYATEKGVDVGIIPCADGGTSIDQWVPGGLLFDHACYMTMLAQRTSTVAAVLWHQGESDCSPERYSVYEEKLLRIIDAFRNRLGLHDVPFLLGGLGDFLPLCDRVPTLKNYAHINESLLHASTQRERVGFVSAVGLTANPDNLHFSAAALRAFGERYYTEFLKHEDQAKIYPEKPSVDDAIVNELESL
jgi:hypothetical protein